jgi:hypothetical protein
LKKTKSQEVDAVTSLLFDPNIFNQVKNSLASRRKSYLDRLSFKARVGQIDCFHEIQKLTPDEFKHLKGNRAIYMVRMHIDTMGRCDITLREKRDQLSRHQQIVNSV